MIDKLFYGKVIWFDPKKGFGFIEFPGQDDIFVYFSDIISEGFKLLKKEQKVSFNIGKNSSGKVKAINVKVVEDEWKERILD